MEILKLLVICLFKIFHFLFLLLSENSAKYYPDKSLIPTQLLLNCVFVLVCYCSNLLKSKE